MTLSRLFFVFFNDTATTEIYTLSLHDALPIRAGHRGEAGLHVPRATSVEPVSVAHGFVRWVRPEFFGGRRNDVDVARSEEHTSELQSRQYLVCRLLLEKKKIK